jgi:hypothetical protein
MSGDFAYVAIPEDYRVRPNIGRAFNLVVPKLQTFGATLPQRLASQGMHLDPDFAYLTYGDQGQRAIQICTKLQQNDLLVFYAALRDVNPQPRLIYALVGLYIIEQIVPAVSIPASRWDENAHTRQRLPASAADIVVRARPSVSGRLVRGRK